MKCWMLVFSMLLAATTAYGDEPSPFEVDAFALDFSAADFFCEPLAQGSFWPAIDAICEGLAKDGTCQAGQCIDIPWTRIQATCPADCAAQKCAAHSCAQKCGKCRVAVKLVACDDGKCACGDKCQCGSEKSNGKCACGNSCPCARGQCQVKCSGGNCKVAKCDSGKCCAAKCSTAKCACQSKCSCGAACQCGDQHQVAKLKQKLQAAHQHIEYRAHLAEYRAQAMEREQAIMFELMEAKAVAAASQAALEQQTIAQHQQQELIGQMVRLAQGASQPQHANGQLQARLEELTAQNVQLRKTIEELRLHVELLARQPSLPR